MGGTIKLGLENLFWTTFSRHRGILALPTHAFQYYSRSFGLFGARLYPRLVMQLHANIRDNQTITVLSSLYTAHNLLSKLVLDMFLLHESTTADAIRFSYIRSNRTVACSWPRLCII